MFKHDWHLRWKKNPVECGSSPGGFGGREPRISKLGSLSQKAMRRGEQGTLRRLGKCLFRLCALSQKLIMRNNTYYTSSWKAIVTCQCCLPLSAILHLGYFSTRIHSHLPTHHLIFPLQQFRQRHHTLLLPGALLPGRGAAAQRDPQLPTPRPGAAAARGRCRPAQPRGEWALRRGRVRSGGAAGHTLGPLERRVLSRLVTNASRVAPVRLRRSCPAFFFYS